MKKIKTYYSSVILWANLLVALVTYSCYSKSYMIGNPSLEQDALDDHPSSSHPSTFDDVLKKINSLFEKFKECSSYVNQHKANYTIRKIIDIDTKFQAKQAGPHQDVLMPYNKLSSIDVPRISSEDLRQVMKLKASPNVSITLHMLIYLNYWQKAAYQHLNDLFHNPFIKPEVFGQSTKASTMVTGSHTKIKLHKMVKNRYVKGKTYHRSYANSTDVRKFADEISDYVNQDIIPYWGTVAQLLIFRLLNSSLAEGKIDIEEAKASYQKALEAIEAIYNPDHIQACEVCLDTELKSAIAYRPGKSGYRPIEIITKLEQCFLQPIEEMYAKLKPLIDEIECTDDDNLRLKEEVRNSLEMFYNIAYGFRIIELIPSFGGLVSIYSSSMHYLQKQDDPLQRVPIEVIHCLSPNLYFAAFIASNDTTLDQTNNKVSGLANYLSNLLKRAQNQVLSRVS